MTTMKNAALVTQLSDAELLSLRTMLAAAQSRFSAEARTALDDTRPFVLAFFIAESRRYLSKQVEKIDRRSSLRPVDDGPIHLQQQGS